MLTRYRVRPIPVKCLWGRYRILLTPVRPAPSGTAKERGDSVWFWAEMRVRRIGRWPPRAWNLPSQFRTVIDSTTPAQVTCGTRPIGELLFVPDQLGDSKVENLRQSVGRYQNIRWLEIQMRYLMPVGRRHGVHNLEEPPDLVANRVPGLEFVYPDRLGDQFVGQDECVTALNQSNDRVFARSNGYGGGHEPGRWRQG